MTLSEELTRRNVTVCGVPYVMAIVDGGVLFSNKSGFYGYSARYMFVYHSHLWHLTEVNTTFSSTPAVHVVQMHKLLCEMVGADHEHFELVFKEPKGNP